MDANDWKNNAEQMMSLLQKDEDIHPDLAPHLTTDPMGQQMVHHPLIVSTIPFPGKFGLVNHQYELRMQAVDEAAAKQDWLSSFGPIEVNH